MNSAAMDQKRMDFIEVHTVPGERPNFARLVEIGKARGMISKRQSRTEFEAILRNTYRRMKSYRRRGVR